MSKQSEMLKDKKGTEASAFSMTFIHNHASKNVSDKLLSVSKYHHKKDVNVFSKPLCCPKRKKRNHWNKPPKSYSNLTFKDLLKVHLFYNLYCLLWIKLSTCKRLHRGARRMDGGRGREGQKGRPTSFSNVTSANVGIIPQNFLTFSFNPFATLVWNFKATLQKKRFFWSSLYKIEVITSLIEMLELPNFGHMTTCTI